MKKILGILSLFAIATVSFTAQASNDVNDEVTTFDEMQVMELDVVDAPVVFEDVTAYEVTAVDAGAEFVYVYESADAVETVEAFMLDDVGDIGDVSFDTFNYTLEHLKYSMTFAVTSTNFEYGGFVPDGDGDNISYNISNVAEVTNLKDAKDSGGVYVPIV